jgi:hypothetical protein
MAPSPNFLLGKKGLVEEVHNDLNPAKFHESKSRVYKGDSATLHHQLIQQKLRLMHNSSSQLNERSGTSMPTGFNLPSMSTLGVGVTNSSARMVIKGVTKNRLKPSQRTSTWSTALNFNQTAISQAGTTHRIPAAATSRLEHEESRQLVVESKNEEHEKIKEST